MSSIKLFFYYFSLIFPIGLMMVAFFGIGLWVAWHLWGKSARAAVQSFSQLCSTIEDQQKLLVKQQIRIRKMVDKVRISGNTMKVSLSNPDMLETQRKLKERELEIERLSGVIEQWERLRKTS